MYKFTTQHEIFRYPADLPRWPLACLAAGGLRSTPSKLAPMFVTHCIIFLVGLEWSRVMHRRSATEPVTCPVRKQGHALSISQWHAPDSPRHENNVMHYRSATPTPRTRPTQKQSHALWITRKQDHSLSKSQWHALSPSKIFRLQWNWLTY